MQGSVEGVCVEEERRTLALSYLISNLFEAESLGECLDVAIKGLSMLDFFQSQISLLEDGDFVVKRNHMDRKYQVLLERIWGRKFLGYKIDGTTPFVAHLLNSKVVTTANIKDAVKVKLEDFIKEYVSQEGSASRSLGKITQVVPVLPKRIDLLMVPLNYRGKVIGAVGFSKSSLERGDVLFLQNVCELFAQAFERVQTRDELRKSEKKYRELIESLYEGIWVIDKDAYTTFVNSRMAEMLGYAVDEMQGKHLFSFMDEHGVEIAKRNLERRKRGIKEEHDFEFLRKDGTRVYTRLATSPLTDAEGNYMGAIAGLVDITKHRRAEEALRESEEKFRNIFESANDCMIYLDRSGRILDVNRKAVEVFGGSKKGLLGKHFTRVGIFSLRDIPRLMSSFAKILAGNQPTLNISIKNKKGREIPLECSASSMKINGKLAAISVIARDVTERKKAEEELIRLSSAVKMSTDSIVISVLDGKIIDVNEATLKMYGTDDKRDLIGKNSFDLIAPEERERALAGLKEVLEKGYLKNREYHIITKDGSTIPVEMNVAIMKDADDQPIGFVGISRDITERKKMEERYRDLVEKEKDIIYTLDDEGNVTFASPAVETILGYRPEEVIGKDFLVLIPREWQEKTGTDFNSLLKTGEITAETVLLDKKEQPHFVEYSSTVIKEGNKVVGTRGIVRDITERKKMEEKLKQYSENLEELVQKRTEQLLESERRYSVLVEEARDGVAILQDGKIVFANKSAEVLGYSRDELIGLSFEKLVDEKYLQLVRERYMRRLQGEEVPSTYEIAFVAKSGERIPIELSATLIDYQGRRADLVLVRDIRERKRMEEERLRLEKLATIGELATMVGHDLRNPLQSIENATYYLNNELPCLPIPQKATEMLQIINNSVNYADKVIRDLQDFSATKKPILKETNINAIVKEALSQVEAPENVELITKLGHPPEVNADKDMIKRAFLNLAINGIQAMKKGGKLKVSTKKTKGFAQVSFKDTGVGMSKETMEKLFTPFFTTKAKGMGMGLPICKRFVDAHDGSIEVKSQEGKGSTFTVKLPIK